METEVVYVVNSDFGPHLFASLGSLLATSSSYDRIRVFCVGERPSDWIFGNDQIVVEEVESLSDDFFLLNKTYLTQSPAERVIYLDADTLVVQSLDAFWKDSDADILAREDPIYYLEQFDGSAWKGRLGNVGGHYIPYLNSGVVVFQHGVHRKISKLWPDLTRKERDHAKPLHGPRYAEQIALSLSIAASGLSVEVVGKDKHGYAWGGDPVPETIVYHTGARGFYPRIYAPIASGEVQLQFCSKQPWGPTTRTLVWNLFRVCLRRLRRRAKRQIKKWLGWSDL